MSLAGIGQFQHWDRMQWRRFLLPAFAIWLAGSLLIVVASIGWLLLSESAVSRSNVLGGQIDSHRLQMRF